MTNQTLISQRGLQVVGFLLWRFGLLLIGATALYRTSRFLLQFIDLPLQIEIGIGFVFSGAVLFVVSLVMERIVDARDEKGLSH